VISSYLDYAGLIEDYNVTYNRLVAGEYKDMGTPWKELTDEEERIFQGKLDIMYDYFVETVAENRNKTVEATEELAQGLIYTGEEAVQNGLIDELGSEDEVHAYIEDKHNITVDTVTYKQQRTFLSLLGGVFERHGYAMGEGVASELSSERQTTPIRT
jgi:protease-4